MSVVIPHYGDPRLAQRLIADLGRQEGGLLREVIVADDHSPTPFPVETPDVTVIRRGVNGGFGAAVNTGCAAAAGELLLILNSDIRMGPTLLQELCAASMPYMPALTGPAYAADWPLIQAPAGRFPTPLNTAFARTRVFAHLRDRRWALRLAGMDLRARPGRIAEVEWLVGAVMLVPRETFWSVGGFDESYFMFSEEVDIQRRLHERGIRSVFIGSVVATHEGGASTSNPEQLAWRMRSVERYFRTWGGLYRYRAVNTVAHLMNFVWDLLGRTAGRGNQPFVELARWLRLTWRPGG